MQGAQMSYFSSALGSDTKVIKITNSFTWKLSLKI